MKELKDYLHLYLGCECVTPDGVLILNGLNINDSRNKVWFYCRWNDKSHCYLPKQNADILGKQSLVGKSYAVTKIKPILRPLSDMTDEEALEFFGDVMNFKGQFRLDRRFEYKHEEGFHMIYDNSTDKWYTIIKPDANGLPVFNCTSSMEDMLWLLSKHFDLFGLIEAGLAIDSTTLKTAKP